MNMNEYGQPVIADKSDFAEAMREIHFAVAFSNNSDISGGNAYRVTKACFLAAIAISYPELDAERIYDIWVDCNETVAYCVTVYRTHNLDKARNTVIDTIMDVQDISGAYDNSEQDVLYNPI